MKASLLTLFRKSRARARRSCQFHFIFSLVVSFFRWTKSVVSSTLFHTLFFFLEKVFLSRLSRKNKLKIHAFRRQLLRFTEVSFKQFSREAFSLDSRVSHEKTYFWGWIQTKKWKTFHIFNSIWFSFYFQFSTIHIPHFSNFLTHLHSTSTFVELKALKDILK